jgi:hypothetical protein
VSASQGPHEPPERSAPATPFSDPEPFGPIELTRYRKDDGRALLLFAERAAAASQEPGK